MGSIINPYLCVRCKGKNLCGRPCYFLEALKLKKEKMKIKERDVLFSPPSIFVGRFGYPNVSVGSLVTKDESPELHDNPKIWFKNNLDVKDVLEKRLSLVNSAVFSHIKRPAKLVEVFQEVAISRDPLALEFVFKKMPTIKLDFSHVFSPVGIRARVESAWLMDTPKTDKLIEKKVYDEDLKATQAAFELYEKGVEEARIARVLSAGMLGTKKERKLVPTRWSITAVDDILGRWIIQEIRNYEPIDGVYLYYSEYNGNRFWIMLVPTTWKYELLEVTHSVGAWREKYGPKVYITRDSEDFLSRKKYVDETAGGYYAARLAVLEHLKKLKKQAGTLIVREILPDYWAPLGVWLVRETVRDALSRHPRTFDEVSSAISTIHRELVSTVNLYRTSKLLRNIKEKQSRILLWTQ